MLRIINVAVSDFKLPQEARGSLFITKPLQYTMALQNAINSHSRTALKEVDSSNREAKGEGGKARIHASFLNHMQGLQVILQDEPSAQVLANISRIVASAPDPISGEPYPDELVLAYEGYLCAANTKDLQGWLWFPAALAQTAIEEAASSTSMRHLLHGIGAMEEGELRWVHE
jgi:hypothetical protein